MCTKKLTSVVVALAMVGLFGCGFKDDAEGRPSFGEGDETSGGDSGTGFGSESGTTDGTTDDGADSGETTDGGEDETGEEDTSDTDDSTDDTTETTGEDCNVDDDVVLYLSPDDSNSMSSPVQVRERVLSTGSTSLGNIALRPWEFMNYYHFPYPDADPGTVALHTEMLADANWDDRYGLQIAVASETLTQQARAPMNIALVLDTSGSMQGKSMDMLKESCLALAASLKAGDEVSLVQWDTEQGVVLGGYEVSGPNDPTLVDAIEDLQAGGGTDLHAGLNTGYDLAMAAFDVDRINRLVLISDGGANAGVTDIDLISSMSEFNGGDGIYLVGVGVGEDLGYNDELMDRVTDAGKGASVYIWSEQEAWKVFNQNFVNTMGVAARDVQVELIMPPGFEIVKFSGEEFSGDPTEIEPQHLSPNDAMVFYQDVETCAPDLVDESAEITVTATFKDASTFEVREVTQTYTFGELLGQEPSLLYKGAAIVAYADGLREYQQTGTSVRLERALEATDLALQHLPEDADLLEIREIVEALL